MALRIRRGLESNRTSMTPALVEGELAYVTNHVSAEVSPLWIGDGSTAGGIPVAPVVTVNSKVGTVELYTDDITESDSDTNFWFRKDRAQDAAAALLLGATGPDNNLTVGTDNSGHTGISFTYNDGTGRLTASVSASGTVSTGTAGALGYYSTATTTIEPTSSLTWSESANLLTVDAGIFKITAGNGPRVMINLETHNNTSSGNSIAINKARGYAGGPVEVSVADVLGQVTFGGWDGNQFVTGATIAASVNRSVTPGSGIVPSAVNISAMGQDGVLRTLLRVTDTGVTVLGPQQTTDTGTGLLRINSTVNSTPSNYNNSALTINTYFSNADGQNVTFTRARGTYAIPTTVVSGDEIIDLAFLGYDGSANVATALITVATEGTITTGKVPGNISIKTANINGTLVEALKISTPSTSTTVANVNISATLSTTSTPATFWNYDVSESTLTLTLGQELTFANFSGSILVNCYNSGTVTHYLCGGGTATAVGSSVAQTGSIAYASGASGYTFTASEAGIHSFYVIRTRAVGA